MRVPAGLSQGKTCSRETEKGELGIYKQQSFSRVRRADVIDSLCLRSSNNRLIHSDYSQRQRGKGEGVCKFVCVCAQMCVVKQDDHTRLHMQRNKPPDGLTHIYLQMCQLTLSKLTTCRISNNSLTLQYTYISLIYISLKHILIVYAHFLAKGLSKRLFVQLKYLNFLNIMFHT